MRKLFGYARPDAVITVDGVPVVAIEQTAMNPSGHNIPQRFSALLRAAELGVAGILYYPEFSRRTFSDPNVRYLQVRVPLANLRLMQIYNVPSLSMFWPTDPKTKLPAVQQSSHQKMADIVDLFVRKAGSLDELGEDPLMQSAVQAMKDAIAPHGSRYRTNPSVRRHLPRGYAHISELAPWNIDPPQKALLKVTAEEVARIEQGYEVSEAWLQFKARLLERRFSLSFSGTINQAGNDSEHPWPGYLSLLDVLYTRQKTGRTAAGRDQNLFYSIGLPQSVFEPRLRQATMPTPTRIVYELSDLIFLRDAIVVGRPIRGQGPPISFRKKQI